MLNTTINVKGKEVVFNETLASGMVMYHIEKEHPEASSIMNISFSKLDTLAKFKYEDNRLVIFTKSIVREMMTYNDVMIETTEEMLEIQNDIMEELKLPIEQAITA